jgi:hypothetical protein
MPDHTHNLSSQRGSVLVLVTISMVVLLGMAGLGLDMGHAYLMKTRLQNALDAAALSGAKTLDETGDPVQAEIDARNTFSVNAGGDMNDAGLALTAVEFSDILFDPAQALDPRYIRVSLAGYQQLMWFAQILPTIGNNKLVDATAVAGPSPVLGEICDIMPVMVCGDPDADDDCSDGSCFGYNYNPLSTDEIVLKNSSHKDAGVGAGNYQLIRLGDSTGGADVRENLAGGYEGCTNTDGNLETEPGKTVGPVAQGINTRFGIYQGPFQPEDKDTYKPDLVSDTHAPTYYYSEYDDRYTPPLGPFDHPLDGEAHRRVVAVPIGNCTGTTNGQGTVPLLGVACFFLTRPAEQNGAQEIYGQIVPGCEAHGTPGPDPGTGPGPYIIQLYKDPDNTDA